MRMHDIERVVLALETGDIWRTLLEVREDAIIYFG